jgi:protein-L-isoaspartate(D-aspartate) O-methyltransferase
MRRERMTVMLTTAAILTVCRPVAEVPTSPDPPAGDPADPFAAARGRMVDTQLASRLRGITDARVLEAMRTVPRHEFVPEEMRPFAYDDRPLPIGHDQTISQPFITEALDPKPGQRVLEVGTGSGYQAAVLARLVKEVFSIEIVEPLAQTAKATLARLAIKNVHVRAGDGYKGWPDAAPFDSIIVTCAPDHIPEPLIDQLKPGGRMIIPVGGRTVQELILLEKSSGQLKRRAVLPVRFVPMTGEASSKSN